jgi:hypothetical protein
MPRERQDLDPQNLHLERAQTRAALIPIRSLRRAWRNRSATPALDEYTLIISPMGMSAADCLPTHNNNGIGIAGGSSRAVGLSFGDGRGMQLPRNAGRRVCPEESVPVCEHSLSSAQQHAGSLCTPSVSHPSAPWNRSLLETDRF